MEDDNKKPTLVCKTCKKCMKTFDEFYNQNRALTLKVQQLVRENEDLKKKMLQNETIISRFLKD